MAASRLWGKLEHGGEIVLSAGVDANVHERNYIRMNADSDSVTIIVAIIIRITCIVSTTNQYCIYH